MSSPIKNLKSSLLASVGELTCSKCSETKSALEFPLRPDGKRLAKCSSCRYQDNDKFPEAAKFTRNPRPTVAEANHPRTVISHTIRQSYNGIRKIERTTADHAAVLKVLETQASDVIIQAKPGFNPRIKERLTLGQLCLLFFDPVDQLTVALAANLVMVYGGIEEEELAELFYKPASAFYGCFHGVPLALGKMPLRKWAEAASETATLFTDDDLTAKHECVSALLAYSQVLSFWLRFPADISKVLQQHNDWLSARSLASAAESVYGELRNKMIHEGASAGLMVDAIPGGRKLFQ